MTELVNRLNRRLFDPQLHPYNIYEAQVRSVLARTDVLVDAGCGRSAPTLIKFRGLARDLIGVDLVDFSVCDADLRLIQSDMSSIPLDSCAANVVMAQSVMEHIEKPLDVFREVQRILKPGGHFIFLTASLYDYASVIAMLVPNRFHPWVVSRTEGRRSEDVFPTQYKVNTRRRIRTLAAETGFSICRLDYLGQYPAYFTFNAGLFLVATAYEKLISRFELLAPLRGWILADLVRC